MNPGEFSDPARDPTRVEENFFLPDRAIPWAAVRSWRHDLNSSGQPGSISEAVLFKGIRRSGDILKGLPQELQEKATMSAAPVAIELQGA